MENKTKGAGDDYPIIPQPLDDKQLIEKAAIKYVIEATGYQVLPEHEHWKEAFIAGANLKEKELASLKEVVKELIPIAERMKSACESGETLCFDNEYDLRNATAYQKVIDRAKRISDNK